MPANSALTFPVSNTARISRRASSRTKRPLRILGAVVAIALAVMVSRVVASGSSSTSSVLTPALRLAAGTLSLEGTGQAVDAASAAKLLPMWELLAQLNSSGSAAPEEITATIEEIKLNMTAAQISAIDATSISNSDLGLPGSQGSAPSRAAAGTQVASAAASNPMMTGGDPAAMGAAPMDGGGPMPSGSTSTSTGKTSAASSTPAVIQQVIALLKSKIQS